MHAPDPVAFTLFGLDVRWYGILIGIGFLLAIYISYRRAPHFGIDPEHVLDLSIFLIPFSIIGARLYYVLFNWKYYSQAPASVLDLRSGGLAIHGGIIVGVLVALAVCRHFRISYADMADLIFPQVSLAQSIGRWGNFFNAEAHGGPTSLPWAIEVNGEMVHPTFLYESLWCLALFFFLLFFTKRRHFKAQITLLYLMLYSLERFFVEGLRTDSLMIGSLRQAQVLSAGVFVVTLIIYILLRKKAHAASNGSMQKNVDEDTHQTH